jgi:hypothetical protein
MPGIFPDYAAPIVRNASEGREIVMARWGMPSSQQALLDATKKRAQKLEANGKAVDFKELLRMEPDGGTTNIRKVKSAHWKRWLDPEHRFREANPLSSRDRRPAVGSLVRVTATPRHRRSRTAGWVTREAISINCCPPNDRDLLLRLAVPALRTNLRGARLLQVQVTGSGVGVVRGVGWSRAARPLEAHLGSRCLRTSVQVIPVRIHGTIHTLGGRVRGRDHQRQ